MDHKKNNIVIANPVAFYGVTPFQLYYYERGEAISALIVGEIALPRRFHGVRQRTPSQ